MKANKNIVKVIFITVLPCFNAIIWMHIISNCWIAMYSMHIICMLLIPFLIYGSLFIRSLLKTLTEIKKQFRAKICAFLVIITVLLVMSIIILDYNIHKLNIILKLLDMSVIKKGLVNKGILNDKVGLKIFTIISSVYFCIINPIIEELFWRFFVFNELLKLNENNEQNESNVYLMDIEQEPKQNDIEMGISSYENIKNFETLICSVLYSIYHFFVIIHFSNFTITLLCTFLLVIMGEILLFIRRKYHILYSICIHVGLDISLILFLWIFLI